MPQSSGMGCVRGSHFHSLPGNSVEQYEGNTGLEIESISAIKLCSVSKSGDQFQPRGWMSNSAAPSKNPCSCTVSGNMAATVSTAKRGQRSTDKGRPRDARLFIAPMAPALHPPKSMRCPAVAPSL